MSADSRKKISVLWKYFTDIANDKFHVSCNLCSAKISRGGKIPRSFNTSIMKNHLQGKHTKEFKALFPESSNLGQKRTISQAEICLSNSFSVASATGTDTEIAGQSGIKTPKLEKHITLEESFELQNMYDIDSPIAKSMHRRIARSIVIDIHPLSYVESLGLKEILAGSLPRYNIPSRHYFTDKVIPGMYDEMLNKIKLEISAAHYISITTDIWTATVNNTPFLSMTGHWFDDNFYQHAAILNVIPFKGSHTGDRIAEYILKGLDIIEIPTYKVHIFMCDNAYNMVKGLRVCGLESMGCFVHTLQLCIKDSIFTQSSVIEILSICRKTATLFNNSAPASHKLTLIQQQLNVPEHKLKQDVTTRWDSTFLMIERYMEQKGPLVLYSLECQGEGYGITNLTNNQWELLGKLVKLLRPFQQITKHFCLRETTTSSIIPTILGLKAMLEKAENILTGVKSTVSELKKSVEKRFNALLTNNTCCLATFLDPRHKLVSQIKEVDKAKILNWAIEYLQDEERLKAVVFSDSDPVGSGHSGNVGDATGFKSFPQDTASENLTEESFDIFNCLEEYCQKQISKPAYQPNVDTLFKEEGMQGTSESSGQINILTSSRSKKESNRQVKLKFALEAEIDKYLTVPLLERKSDPFSYWRVAKQTLPLLQKLALKYLSAPPTSVENERLFNTGGNIYTPKRNLLSPELAEVLMVLHFNIRMSEFNK